MGGGSWVKAAYDSKVRDMGFTSKMAMVDSAVHQVYRQRKLAYELNPRDVIRECRDSEEHPETLPIILALDVTGSMGRATKMCAAKLDEIMDELYKKVKDVEFCMMGIGDLAYDDAPIQVSQFESDIRIMDQTAKIWFEGGGGGNSFESYTAAWYFGLRRCDLDCWKRGKKGIIITMGDEPLNPYLPGKALEKVIGNRNQQGYWGDVETNKLYEEACEKFDIYHIAITDDERSYRMYERRIDESWGKLLGQRLLKGKSDDLPKLISQIVTDHLSDGYVLDTGDKAASGDGMIRW